MRWAAVGCLALVTCAHVEPPSPARAADVCDPVPQALPDGQELFVRNWLEGDARSDGADGLGPLFNDSSCVGCHSFGGVGGAGPKSKNVKLISLAAVTQVVHRHGGRAFDPDQPTLHVPKPPGIVLLGTSFPRPTPRAGERNTPALFGAGLVDLVPDAAILEAAAAKHPGVKGISGRPARDEDGRIGRFGWKGQIADLDTFVAKACANEMGLDVPTAAQPLPVGAVAPTGHDLGDAEVAALTAFVAGLRAPEEREHPDRALGEALFDTVGCAACHAPALGGIEGLYSDLLLHDLGAGLADSASGYGGGAVARFAEGPANPGEWRTPPLWGVGDSGPWLHDGRAPSLEAAILAHGGEAEAVTARYRRLGDMDQLALVIFLETLVAPSGPSLSR